MKKASLVLVMVTLVFAAFTGGFFTGRNVNHSPVQHFGTASADTTPSETQAVEETQAAETPSVIDLNTATQADLESLPGIGAVLARRILDYREASGPFEDISQLANVEGIGEKRLEAIMEYICIGGQYENTGG